MKRVIKDYNSITDEHAALIEAAYPNGFENDNLVSFTTPKGAFIKALEIRTEDTIYLFKIDKNMKVDEEEGNDDGIAINDIDGFKSDEDSSENDDDDDNDTSDDAEDSNESDEDED
jgi:DNA-directed RNA polymerase subunit delta